MLQSRNYSTVQDIETVEEKLVEFDEEDIKHILLRTENYRLLEDERPTKRFLTLENYKYNNVSRLKITDIALDTSTNPPTEIKIVRYTTDPEEILGEFQLQFAAIYSNQPTVDGSEESIIDFLNSEGDKEPLHALHQRKQCITPDEFTLMEGLMTEGELTEGVLCTWSRWLYSQLALGVLARPSQIGYK